MERHTRPVSITYASPSPSTTRPLTHPVLITCAKTSSSTQTYPTSSASLSTTLESLPSTSTTGPRTGVAGPGHQTPSPHVVTAMISGITIIKKRSIVRKRIEKRLIDSFVGIWLVNVRRWDGLEVSGRVKRNRLFSMALLGSGAENGFVRVRRVEGSFGFMNPRATFCIFWKFGGGGWWDLSMLILTPWRVV